MVSLDKQYFQCEMEINTMERIKTLETRNLCESAQNGGCGECQTSCQSACKTSCTVGNQNCEKLEREAKINKAK